MWKWRLDHGNHLNSDWVREVLVATVREGRHDFMPTETSPCIPCACRVLVNFYPQEGREMKLDFRKLNSMCWKLNSGSPDGLRFLCILTTLIQWSVI
jgi:hypothetical protein